MALSAQQRKLLERYKQFRADPPTVWGLISLSVISHAATIMIVAAGVAFAAAAELPYFASFAAGLGLGAFARDGGMFRRFLQIWPALLAVLDWNKVDAVLAGEVDVPPAP